MAGIYLHIPYCRQACHYCNFHFSTSLQTKSRVVEAMVTELGLRKEYLQGEPLDSIYFGGGTPSLLTAAELALLLNTIRQLFIVEPAAEITLEANPDDLSTEKLHELATTGVNRLSIGVQSFYDADLKWMNRAHNAVQALTCIKDAQIAGISNISIDLIYGIPGLTDEQWKQNITTAAELNVDHISSYALTVETSTTLHHLIKHSKLAPIDEEQSARQFEILVAELQKHGFEQYEISNFAHNSKYAVHNTNYWKGKKYLGIGPSAHSYNLLERSWNIASNAKYAEGILSGNPVQETETLTAENRLNEYLMTGLRTKWGCDLSRIRDDYGNDYAKQVHQGVKQKIIDGYMLMEGAVFRLTPKGKLYADGIASDLFA